MDVAEGVQAESPTAEVPVADPTQATTPPVPQQNGNFIPYDRFQQVNSRMHAAEARANQLQQQWEQAQRERQQSGQPQPSAEEMQAGEALKRLIAQHPELRGLLDAPKYGQQLEQLQGQLGQLMSAQQSQWVQSGQSAIQDFGKANGLTPQGVQWLENSIAGWIRNDPDLYRRAMGGQLNAVVGECLSAYEQNVMRGMKREATATVAQTKLTQAKLPPRSTGGAPGAAAPTPLTQDNEIDVRRQMHRRAFSAWEDAQKG